MACLHAVLSSTMNECCTCTAKHWRCTQHRHLSRLTHLGDAEQNSVYDWVGVVAVVLAFIIRQGTVVCLACGEVVQPVIEGGVLQM